MTPERIQALRRKYPKVMGKMFPAAEWIPDINELLDAVEHAGSLQGCKVAAESCHQNETLSKKTPGGAPCSVCGKKTIAMCPYCHEYVCPDYNRADCGTLHEAKCPQAKEARKCPAK